MILSFRTFIFWANSADPDQTAPKGAVRSGSTLFAIPSASFGYITLWSMVKPSCSNVLCDYSKFLGCPNF